MAELCESKYTRGLAVMIEIQDEDGKWFATAAQRGGTLNRTAETMDTSSKDDFGWSNMEQGVKSWSIDCDGLYVEGNKAFDLLNQVWLDGSCVRVRVRFPSGVVYVGQAILTDFPYEFGYQDSVTYSLTFEGKGALEKDQVAPVVLPKSINITPASPTVAVKSTVSLSAAVLPVGAPQEVTYTSLTPLLATVAPDGKVTGVKAGSASIVARSTTNSSISKTITVTVTGV